MTELEETEEAEATYFAMCILMPETFVRDEVEKLGGHVDLESGKEIRQLAKIFKVSETVMTVRLCELYGTPGRRVKHQ